MSEINMLFLALAVPFCTGALFVVAVWDGWRAGGWLLVLGLSFPLGLLGIITGYLLLDKIGVGLNFWANVCLQLGLAATFYLIAINRKVSPQPEKDFAGFLAEWKRISKPIKWVTAALILFMFFRWVGIFLEVWIRPLQPWDAWYSYGLKAKVFFYTEKLDSFASHYAWFAAESAVYDVGGRRHPPGISLVQLWFLQSINRWDPSILNLAWPVGLACLGFITFGFLRLNSYAIPVAVLGSWLVLSIPMVTISSLLAGMADFWVCIYLLIVFCAIWSSRENRECGLFYVASAALVLLLLSKQTSYIWLLPIILGTFFSWFHWKGVVVFVIAVMSTAVGYVFLRDTIFNVSWIGTYGFRDGILVSPGFQPILEPLMSQLLWIPNWHLLWYLAPVMIITSIVASVKSQALLGYCCGVLASIFSLGVLFFFSHLGAAVVDGTSVNRIILSFVPSFIVLFIASIPYAFPKLWATFIPGRKCPTLANSEI